jgi:plasmid stabilization system protein ParE
LTRRQVTYLPDAIEDLHGIWAYIAEQSQSLEVADRLIDAIDDAAMLYAANPDLGTPRPDLASALRCFSVGSYVAFYLTKPDRIQVVQIIHGARDIPVHFRRTTK